MNVIKIIPNGSKSGKFILYANIPYLCPPNKLGGPWGIGFFLGGRHMLMA